MGVVAQKLKHFSIQFVASKIFVCNVLATAVQYAEVAAKIPERVAPARFFPDGKRITHPREHNVVRSLVVRAPFSDVNLNAAIRQWLVFIDVLGFEAGTIPKSSFVVCERPCWRLHCFVFVSWNPGCSIVAQGFGLIAACALHDVPVREFDDGILSDVDAVGKDEPLRIFISNCCDQRSSYFDVALLECALVGAHAGRFVDQIEAEVFAGHSLVAFGEGAPVEHCRCKCSVAFFFPAGEEVGGLEFAVVDAIAGDAVEVEIDMNAMLLS